MTNERSRKSTLYFMHTVNSLYSGHRRDLKLVSSLARVRNSGNLFQSNVCNLFFPGIYSCCPFYWGVRYSEVSARRELTVPRSWRCRWQRIRRQRKTKETDYSMNNKIGLSSTDTPSAYIHVHLVCWTWLEIRLTDQTRSQAIAEYWPSSLVDANKNANKERGQYPPF